MKPLLALLALGIVACDSDTTVKDSFSHACTTDDDCVLAYLGDACRACPGSNAAIAKSAQASYQQALNSARDNCPKDGPVGFCDQRYAISKCEQNTCKYVECGQTPPTTEHRCSLPDGGR